MELIVIRARSARLEDALALRLLFPEMPLDDLRQRLRDCAPLPAINFENHLAEAARRLGRIIQVLREQQIPCHVHHLIEDGETVDDPYTEIDLDLLETVLEGSLPSRSRFADFGSTG